MKLAFRVAVAFVVLLTLAAGGVYVLSSARLAATYDVPVAFIETSTDSAVLARGAHVARIRGCVDCHAEDLSGRLFFDAMPVGRIRGTNLTSGANGVGGRYSDADFVRAIRSGVRPDGSPLLIMPSYEYRALGPEDLGALVSWIKSVPPVDTDPVEQTVGPLGRVLYLSGQIPLVPAEMIDHSDPSFAQPERAASVEYGRYLATSCVGCHGDQLVGGPMTGAPPDWPDPPNLTPDVETGIGSWTRDDFMHFAETGDRPDGRHVDPTYMPWPALKAMSDVERDAIWLYLRSLPASPRGS